MSLVSTFNTLTGTNLETQNSFDYSYSTWYVHPVEARTSGPNSLTMHTPSPTSPSRVTSTTTAAIPSRSPRSHNHHREHLSHRDRHSPYARTDSSATITLKRASSPSSSTSRLPHPSHRQREPTTSTAMRSRTGSISMSVQSSRSQSRSRSRSRENLRLPMIRNVDEGMEDVRFDEERERFRLKPVGLDNAIPTTIPEPVSTPAQAQQALISRSNLNSTPKEGKEGRKRDREHTYKAHPNPLLDAQRRALLPVNNPPQPPISGTGMDYTSSSSSSMPHPLATVPLQQQDPTDDRTSPVPQSILAPVVQPSSRLLTNFGPRFISNFTSSPPTTATTVPSNMTARPQSSQSQSSSSQTQTQHGSHMSGVLPPNFGRSNTWNRPRELGSSNASQDRDREREHERYSSISTTAGIEHDELADDIEVDMKPPLLLRGYDPRDFAPRRPDDDRATNTGSATATSNNSRAMSPPPPLLRPVVTSQSSPPKEIGRGLQPSSGYQQIPRGYGARTKAGDKVVVKQEDLDL